MIKNLEIIFLIILVLAFIDQIFFYLLYYFRLKPYSKKKPSEINYFEPVSVIIAAKNEAQNLKKNLPKILNQNYPIFEVLVVNDGSTDDSIEILKSLCEKYENLKIINLDRNKGKKEAISIAIKKCLYEYLVFTDADCCPVSDNWLAIMKSKFNDKKQIILGYGPYEKTKGFLNSFIRYDSYLIAVQYFAAATLGVSYMGVGRNLAYKKDIWVNVNGFENHKNILSGDDDLFILEAANSENVEICVDKESFTYSIPKTNFKDFIKQKSRHVSTAKKYKLINILFSAGDLLSRTIFFVMAIFLLFSDKLFFYVVMLIILRITIIYCSGYSLREKFKNKIKLHNYILFDIFAPVFYLGVFVSRLINRNEKKW
ncbi:glycosyltransferase [Bacteroidales bacterium OttesenSCG-928-I21]|nr:glycosyltransferase [Bacteroidales bacterium OttesenSCG-928-I21]